MKVWNEQILISIIVDDHVNPKFIHKYNLKNGFSYTNTECFI